MDVKDIELFFSVSTRAANDAVNRRRELILSCLNNIPAEFYDSSIYGAKWHILSAEWNNVIPRLNNENYTSTVITIKGGRKFNYDAEIMYYNNDSQTKLVKIEFKYNSATIDALPQVLSLNIRFNMFEVEYHKFYYENYINKYLLFDDIKYMPTWEEYSRMVSSVNFTELNSTDSFFTSLKKSEQSNKEDKHQVVNESISDYLAKYGHTINITILMAKIRESQLNKHYVLWNNDKFHLDKITAQDVDNATFYEIKNKNTIVLKANGFYINLLLRWRNLKGILNPAWQISMRRIANDNAPDDAHDNVSNSEYININLRCEICEKLFKTEKTHAIHKKRVIPCKVPKQARKQKTASDEFRENSIKFNNTLSKETRAKTGIYFTPKKVRDLLFEKLNEAIAKYSFNFANILEPSFGSGEFLLDARIKYPHAKIIGVELSGELYGTCVNMRIDDCELINSDFLKYVGKHDVIIGNPPYFVMKGVKSPALTGRPNIYVLFLYKCITEHLNPGGILVFIIPTSIYNCSYYQPTRDYIRENMTVCHLETLNKPGFYETSQETCLIIVKNEKTERNEFFYRGSYLSPHYRELTELSVGTRTIRELGLYIKTGSIVWNEVKDKLSDTDGTLLVYSSNITGGTLDISAQLGGEKKQYVSGIEKPTINGSVILVSRGYGNSYTFNFVYVERVEPFYAENHINVIYGDSAQLKVVLRSLSDDRTKKFIEMYTGNGAISASELENLIPIFM
jgi:hypothetical protein